MNTHTSISLENQFLATKFYVPVVSGILIPRPRLMALLDQSLQYPLTLISAPAGFGKTMLLSTWCQSLPTSTPVVVWISLDEEDNEPQLFWTNILAALNQKQPALFTPLLKYLQSPQVPPLKSMLTALINLLLDRTEQFLVIVDDYHVITEPEIHTTLSYLIEHLPSQLHLIVATRVDPSLPLVQLRARQHMQEIRADQLRCTVEETAAFFHQVVDLDLPEETIQEVTVRTEGWLVGLHLLRLSLPEQANPLSLLEHASGDQRYILDFLTEEVLQRQPQEVQTFLLFTSILEQLSASLCDAIMQQTGSQQMLHQLERANVFVVSLDRKRQWYRYHALFAEALRYQLEQMHPNLVPILHHRASIWYAKQDRTTLAILHAFRAKEWHWAADLIEQKSIQLTAFAWGASEHELVLLREWLEQLPIEIIGSRPRLSLTCVRLLWQIAPPAVLEIWLKAVEATLTATLTTQAQEGVSNLMLDSKAQRELLGDVMAARVFLQSFDEHGEAIFPACEQALSLLSAKNYYSRVITSWAQVYAYYLSKNDGEAAIRSGEQGISLALESGHSGLAITAICLSARLLKDLGQLHEAQRLIQQATQLGTKPGGLMLPEASQPITLQAELLREWNQLDRAQELIEEAMQLSKQNNTMSSLIYILIGYAVLLRISLSRRELEAAHMALQEFERTGRSMNQPSYLHMRSFYTIVDQVRLWLVSGELDCAILWAKELHQGKRPGTLFAHEREEVAQARIFLATAQPTLAIQRLEPVLQRATRSKHRGHVIEIQLLQALAYQMHQEETQALDALSGAIRLAEPEGYIRSFVDEGAPLEALLYRLRKRDRKNGPTPYLDTLLDAFQQESKTDVPAREPTKVHQLPEPLSEREREVLHLIAQGTPNQEIAQKLVITIETVKSHISRIFVKLGVHNRVQAVQQARRLGLLAEEH